MIDSYRIVIAYCYLIVSVSLGVMIKSINIVRKFIKTVKKSWSRFLDFFATLVFTVQTHILDQIWEIRWDLEISVNLHWGVSLGVSIVSRLRFLNLVSTSMSRPKSLDREICWDLEISVILNSSSWLRNKWILAYFLSRFFNMSRLFAIFRFKKSRKCWQSWQRSWHDLG